MDLRIILDRNDNFKKIIIIFNNLNSDVTGLIISYIGLWHFVSNYIKLTNDIVISLVDKILWKDVLHRWVIENTVTDDLFVSYICDKHIGFMKLAEHQIFNDSWCLKFISHNKKWFYSESFIDCFSKKVDWEWIVINVNLPIYMIDRYFNKLIELNRTYHHDIYNRPIPLIYVHQILTNTNFLKKRENVINWTYLTMYQKLSDDQIVKFCYNIQWEHVLKKNIYTMELLNRLPKDIIYKNILFISETQNLSKKFIINHVNIINPHRLKRNKSLHILTQNSICERGNSGSYIFLINDKNYINFTKFH